MKKLLMFAMVVSALFSASCTTIKAKNYAEKVIAAAPISDAAVAAVDSEIATYLAGKSQEKIDKFWNAFHAKYAEIVLPQAEAYAVKVYGGELSFGDKARVLAEIQVHLNHLSEADAATFNDVYGARRDAIIKERTGGFFNDIKDAVNNAVDSVIDAVSSIGKEDVEQGVEEAKQTVEEAVQEVQKWIESPETAERFETLGNKLDELIDAAVEAIEK